MREFHVLDDVKLRQVDGVFAKLMIVKSGLYYIQRDLCGRCEAQNASLSTVQFWRCFSRYVLVWFSRLQGVHRHILAGSQNMMKYLCNQVY